MQVIQLTVSETPRGPRGRMGRMGGPARMRGQFGAAIAKTEPADAAKAVRQVLQNGHMPRGQKALLRVLHEAGDEGLTATELTALLHRNELQLNRLLARVARRIRRTPDAFVLQRPGITLLFDITPVEGEWRYRLRPVTRKTLDAQNPRWLAATTPETVAGE